MIAPRREGIRSVLIVDDEPLVRKFIRIILRDLYHTEEAEDGEKALLKTKSRDFDYVITDVNMPRMDGLSLLSEIKKRRPDTRVIVISGDSATYADLAIERGASYFLPKPSLVDTLHSVLQRV